MRRIFLIAFAAALACTAFVYCQSQEPPARQQPSSGGRGGGVPAARVGARWVYAVHSNEELLKLGGGDVRDGLNKLGDDGWELVSVDPGLAARPGEGARGRGLGFYFKRAKARGTAPFGSGSGTVGDAVFGGAVGFGRPALGGQPPGDDGARFDARVIRLKYARSAQILDILRAVYGPRGGGLASDERTNSLVVAAPESQFMDIVKLVKELDVDVPERAK